VVVPRHHHKVLTLVPPSHYGKDLIKHYSGRASSIAIILLGSILYTWVKHQESQPAVTTSRRGSYERVKMDDLETGEKDTTKQ